MSVRRPALLVSHLHSGGKETCVVNLANALVRTGCSPLVIAFERIGPVAAGLDPRVPALELGKRPGNDLLLPPKLAQVFRREGVDLVHCHNWGTLVEGIVAARSAGLRAIVHTQHGLDYGMDAAPTRRRRVRSFVKGLSSRWVQRIAAVSDEVRSMVVGEWGVPARKVTVIPNGIPMPSLSGSVSDRARRRAAIGLDAGDFVIGAVGTVRPVKDYPTLVTAFAGVARQVPQAKLLIAGDGPARADVLAAIERHGVGDRVLYLGYRTDVPELMPLLDVYASSSLNEGISIAILEAMSHALPVVATRVGGTPTIVRDGETGLLTPAQAAGALADAMLTLTDPALRSAFGRRGREVVEARFSLEQMGREYAELYAAALRDVEQMDVTSPARVSWPT